MTCGYGLGCPGSPHRVATTFQASGRCCGQEFAAARTILIDKVATAAQFLTLRLVVSIASEVICDDSDGPGHAPRYLYVRPKWRKGDHILR